MRPAAGRFSFVRLGHSYSVQYSCSQSKSCLLFAPVYGWFTEGFDTLDLREAKALLDELHA